MAHTICCTHWDNSGDDVAEVNVNDTFTVTKVDVSNRVLFFTPTYPKAVEWDNATFWNDGTLPFTVNQVFTVTAVDLNNRTITMTG